MISLNPTWSTLTSQSVNTQSVKASERRNINDLLNEGAVSHSDPPLSYCAHFQKTLIAIVKTCILRLQERISQTNM